MEEVNWILKKKILYHYAFTKEGKVDTTYSTSYIYDSGLAKDSTHDFLVVTYKDANPIRMATFRKSGNKYSLISVTEDQYNQMGLLSSHTSRTNDSLIVEKRLKYDSANRLAEEMDIKLARTDTTSPEYPIVIQSGRSSGYDTIVLHFNYEKNGLTSKILFTDASGNPLYTIVNVFSGLDPVTSYRLDSRGDTLETTRYSKQGRALKSVITGRDFVAVDLRFRNKLLQAVMENKKNEQRNKVVNHYDRRGMLYEQDYYASK